MKLKKLDAHWPVSELAPLLINIFSKSLNFQKSQTFRALQHKANSKVDVVKLTLHAFQSVYLPKNLQT